MISLMSENHIIGVQCKEYTYRKKIRMTYTQYSANDFGKYLNHINENSRKVML